MKKLLGIVGSFVLTLVFIEIGLNIADPWGIYMYRDNAYWLSWLQGDETYTLPPGDYHLTHYRFTILDDTSRRVPDTNLNVAKKLVLLGDSMTFGNGVNDDQTWANLIARELPQYHVINTAMGAYNSTNVKTRYEQFADADVYLWLTIPNDIEPVFDWKNAPHYTFEPMLFSYIRFIQSGLSGFALTQNTQLLMNQTEHFNRYREEAGSIMQDKRVILLSFNDEFGQKLEEWWQDRVYLINWHTSFVSVADGHPDALGNRQIADQIIASVLPHLP